VQVQEVGAIPMVRDGIVPASGTQEVRLDRDEISRLRDRISELRPGEFHFPEVYGSGWDRLFIGDKVRIGRAFLEAVRAGLFPGVEDTGRKKGRGRVYRWLGQ